MATLSRCHHAPVTKESCCTYRCSVCGVRVGKRTTYTAPPRPAFAAPRETPSMSRAMPPVITSLETNCDALNFVIGGTGFLSNSTVHLVDPNSGVMSGTLVDITPTQVRFHVTAMPLSGIYCVTVTHSGDSASNEFCEELAACIPVEVTSDTPLRWELNRFDLHITDGGNTRTV